MSVFKRAMAALATSVLAFSLIAGPVGMSDAKSASSSPSFSKPASSYSFSKPAPSFTVAPKPAGTFVKPADPPPAVGSGFSKPSGSPPVIAATPAPVAPPAVGSGFSKPSGSPPVIAATPAPVAQFKPAGVLGQTSSKVMSGDALAEYKAERANAKTLPQPVDVNAIRRDPAFTSTVSRYNNVNDYMDARHRTTVIFYNSHPNIRNYSQNMYPNYGSYDNSFLLGMMFGYVGSSIVDNAAWMYGHQNDPWYTQWRADVERQAATDADLRAKLDAMNSEIARLKAQNAQVNATALPSGVDPSLAIAPEAVIANASANAEVANSDDSHALRNTFLLVLLVAGCIIVYFWFVGRKH